MKRWLLIVLYVSACLGVRGQYLHLAGDTTRTGLWLDLDKVWNYNLYEHTRWGGGLLLTTHPQRFLFSRLDVGAYAGYGTFDEQWKYGVGLDEHLRGSRCATVLYQRARHDYTAAGSRRLANPWEESQLLGSFMTQRMVAENSVTLGVRWQLGPWQPAVEFTWGKREWLFDGSRLIYAREAVTHRSTLARLRFVLRHSGGFGSQLDLIGNAQRAEGEATWAPLAARLLADYSHSFDLTPVRLDLYAQGGLSTREVEYADMFDLGGTWGVPLLVTNSLLTVRPNELAANTFLLLRLKLKSENPLYSIYSPLLNLGSNPSPFVAATAVWGQLWGQDAQGQVEWLDSHLQAPHRGLLEPTLGVDGLVRWGAVDWGAAVTYRLAPPSAPYHLTGLHQNLTLLITGILIL